MKRLIVFLPLLLAACHKRPDNPPQVAASGVVTQPTNHCLGATTPWSSPSGDQIHDLSQKDYTIPGFDSGCGDSVRVYMRRPNMFPQDPWTEYFGVDNQASHYILHNGNVVTVYNETGIILEVDVEAILN